MFTITLKIGWPDKGNTSERLTRESWARVRNLVEKRDDATCQYCGKSAPDGEPDHVLPLSRGGTDATTNLVWACKDCNRSKGGKTPREWLVGIEKYTELPPVRIVKRARGQQVIDL